MRVAMFILLVLLGAYGAIVGALYWRQDSFVFPGSGERMSGVEAGLAGVQDVLLHTPDGVALVGWWKPPDPGRAIILYFHGNGGSLANRRERVRALLADGRGLLIVSYRGYSGSTGAPSEAGLRVDAETAYRFLSGYAPKRLVIYGESLGTGVGVRLASEREVGGVILDAPFTSLADVARGPFWFVPVPWLLRTQFRSIDRVAEIGAPLLVLHGEQDGLIPIALGERLFAAAREPKRFVRLPKADHVSVLEQGGLAQVAAFLGEVEARLAAR